jgi:hypothetical protein
MSEVELVLALAGVVTGGLLDRWVLPPQHRSRAR